MVYAKVYHGTKRVKLPLRVREKRPKNPVERRNYRKFDSETDAESAGLKAEHKKFGHSRQRDECPLCEK